MAKQRDKNKKRKKVRTRVVTHPAKPTVKRKAKPRTARAVAAVRDVAPRELFETVLVENVPADEVGAVIAEEEATSDVVSVHTYREPDGEYTIVFVYRRA